MEHYSERRLDGCLASTSLEMTIKLFLHPPKAVATHVAPNHHPRRHNRCRHTLRLLHTHTSIIDDPVWQSAGRYNAFGKPLTEGVTFPLRWGIILLILKQKNFIHSSQRPGLVGDPASGLGGKDEWPQAGSCYIWQLRDNFITLFLYALLATKTLWLISRR